jgi:hypothetical protein
VYFEIIGEIEEIETMASGGGIRDIMRLQKQFGRGRWRKLKAQVSHQVTEDNYLIIALKSSQ